MELPEVVSRAEWSAARKQLLAQEKAATKARDQLNTQRRELPMVRIDKPYTFDGQNGTATLLDLFEDRPQLIVQHFMFDPNWDAACPSCSAMADDIGHLAHLNARATTLAAVSRAPYAKIAAFQQRMGWSFPWYSSYGSDFNLDFQVTIDESVRPFEHNYRSRAEHVAAGTEYYLGDQQPYELPGLSVFLREGEAVFHTYSCYGRGVEAVSSTSAYLDLTPLGRQEDWEIPKGRNTGLGAAAGTSGVRYHDEY